jgi:uncharacterized integral membrane protein
MRVYNIIKWGVRIVLAILVLILLFDNIQTVTFNFFGIYRLTLPLIVLLFIALIIGFIIGYMTSLINKYKAKD